jgi:hypothetical protein
MDKSPWSVRAKPVEGTDSDDLVISYQLSFFLRWHKRIYASVWIALILACLITIYVRVQDEMRWAELVDGVKLSGVIFWLLPFSIGAAIVQSAFGALAKHQLASAIMCSHGQRCPKCFYDLSKRPRDDDVCPECGVIAPRRECVRLWCKLLRSRF